MERNGYRQTRITLALILVPFLTQAVTTAKKPLPDLAIVEFTGPAEAEPGQRAEFRLRLANRGTVDAAAFNAAMTLEPPDGVTPIASTMVSISRLTAGEERTLNLSVLVRASAKPGEARAYLLLDPLKKVAESDETNNRAEIATRIRDRRTVVNTARPSGHPDFVIASFDIRLELGRGNVARARIENRGPIGASPSSCAFQAAKGGRTWSFGAVSVPGLSPGQVYVAELPGIGADLLPGNYRVVATADPGNEFAETDETNNSRETGLLVSGPDLEVSSLSVSPGEAAAQARSLISVSFRIGNRGAPVPESDKHGCATFFYISSSRSMSDPTMIGAKTHPELVGATQAFFTARDVAHIPSLPAGTYYIQAVADPENRIAEENEGNNTAGPVQFTIR